MPKRYLGACHFLCDWLWNSKSDVLYLCQTSRHANDPAGFYEASKLVGLSATTYFLSGLYSLLLPGMYFAKEVKYQSAIQGVAAFLGIVVNFMFISKPLNFWGQDWV